MPARGAALPSTRCAKASPRPDAGSKPPPGSDPPPRPHRRAKAQNNRLYEYIALEASLEIADRYVDVLIERMTGLTRFPNRGTSRDDLRPGLRTIPFRRRLTIADAVKPREVRTIAIARSGQDMKGLVGED